MSKILLRIAIIFIWIIAIAAIVYVPKFGASSKQSSSINIFAWGDIIHPLVVEKFEKETGIKVNINYYASNEELLVKLKATRARGYDLVIPSDYNVKNLRQEGLLKKIDKSKFTGWKELYPFLLGHSFDPKNEYSIPFSWEIYGFAIDKSFFADKTFENRWDLIYKPPFEYRITVPDDPLTNVVMASYYLFDEIRPLDLEEQYAVQNLLIKQKKWVEAYNETRVDYFLATGSCPLGVTSSSYVFRSKKQFPMLGFILPQEGSFITIENLCIPLNSDKEDLVYRFINYLYSSESLKIHYENYAFFTASKENSNLPSMSEEEIALIQQVEENAQKFHFIKSVMPAQDLKDMWIRVKTAD